MATRGVWRGRGAVWRAAIVVTALALVAVVLVIAALLTDAEGGIAPWSRPAAPALPDPAPGLIPASDSAPLPAAAALAPILDALAADPAAGKATGRVLDDLTGQVLWQRDPTAPMTPASSIKLLTAVAALLSLRPDDRIDTVLGEGTDPGTLVVVPGGDVTMSEGGQSPLFDGEPSLDQMAVAVRGAGLAPTRIVVDPGPFNGQPLAPGWSPADIPGGNITLVEPWMTESGRLDPSDENSPRADQPMLAAARALGERLEVPADRVSIAPNPVPNVREIARVQSATLVQRVNGMLVHSDNILAEATCREVALRRTPGAQASFASGTEAVQAVLREHGFDTAGVRMDDCSGMSPENRVPAALLADIVRRSAAPEANRELRGLLAELPVAGASGTLSDRFDGPAASGAGWVRAKTGTLTGASALVGTVTDVDGRSLSFAFLSNASNPSAARPVLDRMAATLHDCGCR